jgi:hypothetical protein
MAIAEIASVINPELTVVDARSILIGNGPSTRAAGAQIVEGVNRLIISGDMVAVDRYCAGLLASYDSNFSISDIQETLDRASEIGLGVDSLDNVEIIEVSTTGVEDKDEQIPKECSLLQNYPNPFNATTTIPFILDRSGYVTLNLFNSRGQRVAVLFSGHLESGPHTIQLNGESLPSGQYVYHLQFMDRLYTRSLMLVK